MNEEEKLIEDTSSTDETSNETSNLTDLETKVLKEMEEEEKQGETSKETSDNLTENSKDEPSSDDNLDDKDNNKEDKKEEKPEKTDNSSTKNDFDKTKIENMELKHTYKQLEEVAKSKGYKDINEFLTDLTLTADILEAKDKNLDTETYLRYKQTLRENEDLKQKFTDYQNQIKIDNLKTTISDFVKEHNLGENGEKEVLTKLEEAGYKTIEDVLNTKNINLVLKGLYFDTISKNTIEKQEKNDNLDKISGTSLNSNKEDSDIKAMDLLVKKALEEYKTENF